MNNKQYGVFWDDNPTDYYIGFTIKVCGKRYANDGIGYTNFKPFAPETQRMINETIESVSDE